MTVILRAAPADLNPIAASYVKLALALGGHDGDYVDAYFGPAEWRTAAQVEKLPLARIKENAGALRTGLGAMNTSGFTALDLLRREYLVKQLRAMAARVEMLEGRKFTFDEESSLVFDAVAPVNSAAHFDAILGELEKALPGPGPLAARVQAYRNQFVIPPDKVDAVFRAAIAAARERTLRHIALPANESFTVEYVTGKPWSGYNWYQGNFHSLIQVNTELPIYIDRAVDLAAHEGYPGHHVYNALLEKNLLRDRGWVEFSVYALFSPQSLIAEGSANYGVDVAFPGAERVAFERDVLFPLAGLDPAKAAGYYHFLDLLKALGFAGNEAARRYLNGEIKADETVAWLTHYAFQEPVRAQRSIRFYDQYRSYVINYNLGRKMVEDYVERRAAGDPERRWQEFKDLISSPRLPSGLK
ncbi:MAG: hypothetical protein PSW75_08220 [bacterium]|nr:hypothetical protein [bacterium]